MRFNLMNEVLRRMNFHAIIVHMSSPRLLLCLSLVSRQLLKITYHSHWVKLNKRRTAVTGSFYNYLSIQCAAKYIRSKKNLQGTKCSQALL